MLEVDKLNVSYGVIPVLHDVSFNVKENEIVTILGSNGTGKSTILNIIQGIMKNPTGRVIFQDEAHSKFAAAQSRGFGHCSGAGGKQSLSLHDGQGKSSPGRLSEQFLEKKK